VRLGGDISESFAVYKRDAKSLPIRTDTCANLWQKFVIFWNGDVTMCCEDVDGDWILGNLNEQSIHEIWNSEKMLAIKRIHIKKQFRKIPLCYTCDMW
jgi:radical SAM protein with 4Fe4S-binding SPASM domain